MTDAQARAFVEKVARLMPDDINIDGEADVLWSLVDEAQRLTAPQDPERLARAIKTLDEKE